MREDDPCVKLAQEYNTVVVVVVIVDEEQRSNNNEVAQESRIGQPAEEREARDE